MELFLLAYISFEPFRKKYYFIVENFLVEHFMMEHFMMEVIPSSVLWYRASQYLEIPKLISCRAGGESLFVLFYWRDCQGCVRAVWWQSVARYYSRHVTSSLNINRHPQLHVPSFDFTITRETRAQENCLSQLCLMLKSLSIFYIFHGEM